MEPLEIRDRRFRLQQEIETLEKQVKALQDVCPHESREEDAEQGRWRCRDCDVSGELESSAVDDGDGADNSTEASE